MVDVEFKKVKIPPIDWNWNQVPAPPNQGVFNNQGDFQQLLNNPQMVVGNIWRRVYVDEGHGGQDAQDVQNMPGPQPLDPPEVLKAPPRDPGPEPSFPDDDPGLRERLGRKDVRERWQRQRLNYLQWLAFQPEPQRQDFPDMEDYFRVLSDWVSQGNAPSSQKSSTEVIRIKRRGEATPRFSLPYSSEEMRLRLRGTIVTIDDRVCYVAQAGESVRDSTFRTEVGPGLVVHYSDLSGAYIVPRLHTLDYRPFEPGYVQRIPMYAEVYIRKPARIFRQGIHQENTVFIDAVTSQSRNLSMDVHNLPALLKSFESRNETKEFTPGVVDDLMKAYKETGAVYPSVRLSNKVAVCLKERGRSIQVLFRGVPCCTYDGCFRFDENFCSLPSIQEELSSVGIKRDTPDVV